MILRGICFDLEKSARRAQRDFFLIKMSSSNLNSNSLQLHKLIRHILGPDKNEDLVSAHFRSSLQLLSTSASSATFAASSAGFNSEMEIAEKIKKQIVILNIFHF